MNLRCKIDVVVISPLDKINIWNKTLIKLNIIIVRFLDRLFISINEIRMRKMQEDLSIPEFFLFNNFFIFDKITFKSLSYLDCIDTIFPYFVIFSKKV